jgi:hypothetical protein
MDIMPWNYGQFVRLLIVNRASTCIQGSNDGNTCGIMESGRMMGVYPDLLQASADCCIRHRNKLRIMVALRAYFDESGTHWGGPLACDVFSLCGYLAQESLWDGNTEDGFPARWNNIMHGRPFHATEMESNPQGPEVKLALANLVNNCGVIGVAGGLSIPDYKRLLRPYVKRTDGTDSPYLFLFADVICETVKRSEMFVGESPDEPIAFVFASHPLWSAQALEFYNTVKDDEKTPVEVRRRMGAVAFEDIDAFVPLQAADHLAFETYHSMNDPPGTNRPAMNRLMAWEQNYGRFYNEQGILSYIKHCKEEGIFQ